MNAEASGAHRIGVRALDALGHIGDATYVNVFVDVLPPAITLDAVPAQEPAGAITVGGFVDDNGNVPPPSHPEVLSGTLDSLDDATVWLEPDAVDDLTNGWVTWIGDFNGDGLGDAAIGLPEASDTGQVTILYGARGGWPDLPDVLAIESLPSVLIASDASHMGSELAPAGDVNGDGRSDLLVGDSANNRLFVVYGPDRHLGPRTEHAGRDRPIERWLRDHVQQRHRGHLVCLRRRRQQRRLWRLADRDENDHVLAGRPEPSVVTSR